MTNKTNTNQKMNKVIQVLISNNMRKTGTFSEFTGYQELRIDEIEMLDFLLDFDGAYEKFIEFTQEHKGEYVDMPIWKLDLYLHSIHNFGYHNSSKVTELDTIQDISEIELKPRHEVFLTILKGIKPDIEKLFVEAYNQTHKERNPFRVEQVLFYLRELLEYEGIKTDYKDFIKAVPHTFSADWKPYFCESNYGFYILDNNNCYSGEIFLSPKDLDNKNELEWTYMASQSPNRWHGNKALAEITVEKLRALRDLSGLSEDLDWKVVYANYNDMREIDPFRGMDNIEAYCAGQTVFIHKEVPKGFKGKHKQALKEINKKFAPIIKEINIAWRAKEGAALC